MIDPTSVDGKFSGFKKKKNRYNYYPNPPPSEPNVKSYATIRTAPVRMSPSWTCPAATKVA